MNQYQTLNPFKVHELHADIHHRIGLQRTLAEHARPVLALEFGVSRNTVIAIENGDTKNSRLPAYAVSEIRRRRKIWRETNDQMQDYTLRALADRHSVSTSTVINQTQEVRYGSKSKGLQKVAA